MNEQSPAGVYDILDWLHEQGKRRAEAVPEFDVEKTLSRVRAARYADAHAQTSSTETAALSGSSGRSAQAYFREGGNTSQPGRPQTSLLDDPVAAVSAELRRLREQAGLTYRDLADRAGYSLATLVGASDGRRLPTWQVTHAYVVACRGDVDAIRSLYDQALTAEGRPVPDPSQAVADLPDPGRAATSAQLVASMKWLRMWAGNPSLAELNRRSGGYLPPSTISGVLRREGLPRRDLVIRYIRACGLPDSVVGQWASAWDRIKASGHTAEPASAGGESLPERQSDTGISRVPAMRGADVPFPRGVFISYRRSDTGPYARLLQVHLSERFPDTPVFMDIDSIEAGLDFTEAIRDAVHSCRVMVALIGSRWVTVADEEGRRRIDDPDDWVRFEIRTALERGMRVIPVLTDGAKPLRDQQLPPDLRTLARLSALEMSYDRFEYDETRLTAVIGKVLAEDNTPVSRMETR
jgi:DNA-binding XRE family transcriptional regulator